MGYKKTVRSINIGDVNLEVHALIKPDEKDGKFTPGSPAEIEEFTCIFCQETDIKELLEKSSDLMTEIKNLFWQALED